jgi:hypothetical protein
MQQHRARLQDRLAKRGSVEGGEAVDILVESLQREHEALETLLDDADENELHAVDVDALMRRLDECVEGRAKTMNFDGLLRALDDVESRGRLGVIRGKHEASSEDLASFMHHKMLEQKRRLEERYTSLLYP